jgi:hypothetical protein
MRRNKIISSGRDNFARKKFITVFREKEDVPSQALLTAGR